MATDMKRCHKCETIKPACEWGKHVTWCLACLRNAAVARNRARGIEARRYAHPIVEKVCPGCGEMKPRHAFGEKSNGFIRDLCRLCAAVDQRRRRATNDPAARREAKRRYELTHREKRREHQSRRRARIAGSPSVPVDYAGILERDGLVCGICGDAVQPDDVHIDHVIPLAVGGPHTPENLQVAHSLCNLKKHSKPGVGRWLYGD